MKEKGMPLALSSCAMKWIISTVKTVLFKDAFLYFIGFVHMKPYARISSSLLY